MLVSKVGGWLTLSVCWQHRRNFWYTHPRWIKKISRKLMTQQSKPMITLKVSLFFFFFFPVFLDLKGDEDKTSTREIFHYQSKKKTWKRTLDYGNKSWIKLLVKHRKYSGDGETDDRIDRYLLWLFFLLSHFYCLSLSNYRWSKADPERNNFSAGIHAPLPQATHPEGIFHLSSCLTDPHTTWCLSYTRKTWRLSTLPVLSSKTFCQSAP